MLVEITSNAGDRNGMFRKIQAGCLEARFRFEHSVARFFCSAGLRNHDDNCLREFTVDLVQHAVESIWIRIVEEVNVQWILRCPKRFGDELRAERRTTDLVVTEKLLINPLRKRQRSHNLRIMEGRPPCRLKNLR